MHYGEASTLVAEARALKNGIIVAIQAGYQNMISEGDNNTIIQALQGIFHVPWKITRILEDVGLWLTMINCTIINYIFREANQATNQLAKTGHSITTTHYKKFGLL